MNRAAIVLAAAIAPVISAGALAQEKVTYQDHVLPIFRKHLG